MSLSARAIALDGLGYAARVFALAGLAPVGSASPPVTTAGGGLAHIPTRRPPRWEVAPELPAPMPVVGIAELDDPDDAVRFEIHLGPVRRSRQRRDEEYLLLLRP